MRLYTACLAVTGVFLFSNPVLAEDDEREFARHRDARVKMLENKISCLKRASNWEAWERCHHEAERDKKRRRLEQLKEEQRRLEEELRKHK